MSGKAPVFKDAFEQAEYYIRQFISFCAELVEKEQPEFSALLNRHPSVKPEMLITGATQFFSNSLKPVPEMTTGELVDSAMGILMAVSKSTAIEHEAGIRELANKLLAADAVTKRKLVVIHKILTAK